MRYYESFMNINNDKELLNDYIYAFNKYDGQNFAVKYNAKSKKFDCFGSRTHLVDETDEQFGNAVKLFKETIAEELLDIIKNHAGKHKLFEGITEITFYFEYWGENSFCGMHNPNDTMNLILIDVFLKKKGYVEPLDFIELTKDSNIKSAEVIYIGKLNQQFIDSIKNNVWYEENAQYPSVKEGVVCKRNHLKKGQRLPKVKVKTLWWLNEIKKNYPDNWEELV
jgi:hypothetical protein